MIVTKICKQCGVVFVKRSNNQNFCSKHCQVSHSESYEKNRYKYVQKPKKKYAPGVVLCLRCEKEFKSWDRKLNRICPICSPYNADSCVGVEPSMVECLVF